MTTTAEKRARFRELHQSGCFVLPNPWDIGSARILQYLGFDAIATTSSGFAWTIGRPDYSITMDDVLEHLFALGETTDLPINADFESGFARDPEELAANVDLVIDTGVAGFSIEDRNVDSNNELYERVLAVERIKAARETIDHAGSDVVLVARTERLLIDPSAVREATDTLVALAEAGADCLYAPGVRDKEDIAAMVRAVAPKPLNILALDSSMSVSELADLGVRRISVGGSLARVGWSAMMEAAKQIKAGSFAGLANASSATDLNKVFGGFE
jgi:2-methylisocitrate lyase-like PEP mutase family enzyme